jgi:hypothetical protein
VTKAVADMLRNMMTAHKIEVSRFGNTFDSGPDKKTWTKIVDEVGV